AATALSESSWERFAPTRRLCESSARPQPSVRLQAGRRASDLDPTLRDAGVVANLGYGRGAAANRPRPQVEPGCMPGADHDVVLDRTLVQRSTGMATGVADGRDYIAALDQENGGAIAIRHLRLASYKVASATRRRQVGGVYLHSVSDVP